MWPVCAKIAIIGGEREPAQDNTFREGHESTQTNTRKEQKGRLPSYVARVCDNRKIGGGEREPTQDSTFCAGHYPTQADTRNRRGGSV